jgi:hypothetical protein
MSDEDLLPDRRHRAGWFDKKIGIGQVIWFFGLLFALGSLYRDFGYVKDNLNTIMVEEEAMATKEEVAVVEERLRKWIERFEAFEKRMTEREFEFLDKFSEIEKDVIRLHPEGGVP